MTTPYFGQPWPSGLCDTEEHVDTPVGKLCLECDEPIEEDHQGTFYFANSAVPECMAEDHLVWVLASQIHVPEVQTGAGQVAMNPIHRECGFRAVSGGIGHFEDHEYWCQTRHDPDGGRSRRQSALEVWERTTRMTHAQEN
jgi:hypothetical protein